MSPIKLERPSTNEEFNAAVQATSGKQRQGLRQESAFASLFWSFLDTINSGASGLALIFHKDDSPQEAYLTAQGLRRLANEEGSPVSIHQTEEDDGAPKLVVILRKKNKLPHFPS